MMDDWSCDRGLSDRFLKRIDKRTRGNRMTIKVEYEGAKGEVKITVLMSGGPCTYRYVEVSDFDCDNDLHINFTGKDVTKCLRLVYINADILIRT